MKDILKKLLDVENLDALSVEAAIKNLEAKGCKWRNLGDIELNHARVNIVANPESTIIERITNAMDALLERKALTDPEVRNSKSPREAVSKMLNIKEGYLCNLSDKEIRKIMANRQGVEVFVKVANGVNLFFRDFGIGLTSEEMPNTILALNESNKFRKPYLIGQYGQGGSTTCAFSKYTVIISRKASPENDQIVFTIIRFNELNDDPLAKDGKFEYVVFGNLPPFVPAKDFDFPYGTLVSHIDYQTEINKGFINYYQVLDHYLFDPPLPYSLYYDEWKQGGRRNLLGVRRRIETSELKQYQDDYVYNMPENPQFGKIKIRYYLLKKYEEKKKGERTPVQAERFLYDDKNPIIITYNGQVQGSLPRTILKDECKFGYIYKSLIVQVECEGLTPAGKKAFFTSGRDRLKTPAQKDLTDAVITILLKDDYLKKENERREQESLSEKIGKDTKEVRKKLAEMINRLNPGKFKILLGAAQQSGSGEGTKSKGRGGLSMQLPPLETKDEPTYVKIVNKQDPIPIQKGKTCKIALESDAPDNLLKNEKWFLSLNGGENTTELLVHSFSDFKGGRARVFLKCNEEVRIGRKIRTNLILKHSSGKIIEGNERLIEIVEPNLTNHGTEIKVNAPEIVELTDKDAQYNDFGWNEKTVAEVKEGTQITIYINMSNYCLLGMLMEGRYAEARANRIKSQYLLHVAYHAFIQYLGFKDSNLGLEEEKEDIIKKDELDRAGRTICTAIMTTVPE